MLSVIIVGRDHGKGLSAETELRGGDRQSRRSLPASRRKPRARRRALIPRSCQSLADAALLGA
jgi:hypothetical protein